MSSQVNNEWYHNCGLRNCQEKKNTLFYFCLTWLLKYRAPVFKQKFLYNKPQRLFSQLQEFYVYLESTP